MTHWKKIVSDPNYIGEADFQEGDLIVLQNEIANIDYILEQSSRKKMIVAFNPSPCDSRIDTYDLNCVNYLLVNEVEGRIFAGAAVKEDLLECLHKKYPSVNIILTKGAEGASYLGEDGTRADSGIYRVPVVDTTGAGDTFTGYFLSEMLKHGQADRALKVAAIASGIAVSRAGAAASIPWYTEVAEREDYRLGV